MSNHGHAGANGNGIQMMYAVVLSNAAEEARLAEYERRVAQNNNRQAEEEDDEDEEQEANPIATEAQTQQQQAPRSEATATEILSSTAAQAGTNTAIQGSEHRL